MKIIKYGKYTGEPADAVDLDELMKRMGDFFLQSGFESQYYGMSEFDAAHPWKRCAMPFFARCRRAICFPKNMMSEELRKCCRIPAR